MHRLVPPLLLSLLLLPLATACEGCVGALPDGGTPDAGDGGDGDGDGDEESDGGTCPDGACSMDGGVVGDGDGDGDGDVDGDGDGDGDGGVLDGGMTGDGGVVDPPNGELRVAIGSRAMVAVRPDGTLWMWGNLGDVGQGQAFTDPSPAPVQVGVDNDWTSASVGATHALILKADGTLWGLGSTQRLMRPDDDPLAFAETPIQLGTADDWVAISAGQTYSHGVRGDGSVWAWGDEQGGVFGDGPTQDHDHLPVRVCKTFDPSTMTCATTFDNGAALATGGFQRPSMFIIDTDGLLWAMGTNDPGLLGLGEADAADVARRVCATEADENSCGTTFDDPVVSASIGEGQGFLITEDGRLFSMGDQVDGALGDGVNDESNQLVPGEIGAGQTWRAVATGGRTGLAVTATGDVYGWGRLGDGALGHGAQAPEAELLVPTLLPEVSDVVGVGMSESTSVRWTAGEVFTAGVNARGVLGIGVLRTSLGPTPVPDVPWTGTPVEMAISTSGVIRIDDGSVWTVGGNGRGELTFGDLRHRETFEHACATWDEAEASCLMPLANLSSLSMVNRHVFAISSADEVIGWGELFDENLGQGVDVGANTRLPSPVPAPVCTAYDMGTMTCTATLGDAAEVRAGERGGMALTHGGEVYIWGWWNGAFMGLGDGTSSSAIARPVCASYSTQCDAVLDGVRTIAVGQQHMLAVRDLDGAVFGWGRSQNGAFGRVQPTVSDVPLPVCIVDDGSDTGCDTPLDGASAVAATERFSMAIAGVDDTLYAWGTNGDGELGVGDTKNRLVATPVCADAACAGPLTGVEQVVVVRGFSMARLDDGSVVSWGNGYHGGDAFEERTTPAPVCVQPHPTSAGACETSLMNIAWIGAGGSSVIAIDNSGQLWAWGDGYANQDGRAAGVRYTPQRVDFGD